MLSLRHRISRTLRNTFMKKMDREKEDSKKEPKSRLKKLEDDDNLLVEE